MSPDQVKHLRTKLGLTQAQFAKAMGISRLTMSQYEIGFRKPGTTVLILLRVLDSLSRAKGGELIALLSSHADREETKVKRRRA